MIPENIKKLLGLSGFECFHSLNGDIAVSYGKNNQTGEGPCVRLSRLGDEEDGCRRAWSFWDRFYVEIDGGSVYKGVGIYTLEVAQGLMNAIDLSAKLLTSTTSRLENVSATHVYLVPEDPDDDNGWLVLVDRRLGLQERAAAALEIFSRSGVSDDTVVAYDRHGHALPDASPDVKDTDRLASRGAFHGSVDVLPFERSRPPALRFG